VVAELAKAAIARSASGARAAIRSIDSMTSSCRLSIRSSSPSARPLNCEIAARNA